MTFERLARRGIGAEPDRRDAQPRLHLAGADGASDRGAAQEHPRRRARDRRAARGANARRDRARARRQRGAAARSRHPALADADAAHRQADRRRRDRERAQLLPRHLPGARSRSSIARSRRRFRATRSRASSAWATGSAAIATATRSSTPPRCAPRFAKQSETALRHYLTQVHELGAELSSSATLQPVTPELQRLADASGDASAHREDEPYRRALIGVYARLAATLHALTGTEALRHAVAPRDPYPSAGDFLADLRTVEASLAANHAEALIGPRLAPLIRAAQVFGFHLATVDLRQSSDKHEAVVAELLAVARIESDYSKLDETRAPQPPARRPRRRAAAARRRERARRGVQRSEPEGAGDLRGRRRDAAPLRPRRAAPLHHLAHRERQRPARGPGAAQGSRAGRRHARRRRRHRADRLAAVRDHRRPAQRRGDHARVLRAARHRRDDAALRRRAGRDDRLQRQQQGRRRVHEQLGALLRRDRAGRAVRRARRDRTASRCASSTAAAAPSAAAAGRATRRSWRSRRAR